MAVELLQAVQCGLSTLLACSGDLEVRDRSYHWHAQFTDSGQQHCRFWNGGHHIMYGAAVGRTATACTMMVKSLPLLSGGRLPDSC
jgi:hypothetical protein